MIKLELEISELDYEALLDRLLPLMGDQLRSSGNPLGMLLSNGTSASVLKELLRGLPYSQVETFIVDALNGNSKKIIRLAEETAAQQQVAVKIDSFRAATK